MKIYYIVIALLIATGCAPKSESTSAFTLTTTAPAGLSDARREAWKVERMLQSARFRELAFGSDARFRATKVALRIDRSKTSIEVFVSDSSKKAALEAGRAYADAATRVLDLKREEFEISPSLNVAVGAVGVTDI